MAHAEHVTTVQCRAALAPFHGQAPVGQSESDGDGREHAQCLSWGDKIGRTYGRDGTNR